MLSLGGEKHDASMCTPFFKCYDMKTKRVFHAHSFPNHSSSSMFQDPLDISHFTFKSCPWNFHDQHRVTWTQNQPFHKLRKLGFYKLTGAIMLIKKKVFPKHTCEINPSFVLSWTRPPSSHLPVQFIYIKSITKISSTMKKLLTPDLDVRFSTIKLTLSNLRRQD